MLDGKTVIVTGVGGGLGRECAASALRDGANVVIAARTADALERTAAELDPSGEQVAAQRHRHHRRRRRARRSSSAAQERFGSVDALIQVAAYENVWGGLLRHQVRRLAQGVRDQRARRADRAAAGGRRP